MKKKKNSKKRLLVETVHVSPITGNQNSQSTPPEQDLLPKHSKLKWYTLNGRCRFLTLLCVIFLSCPLLAETVKGVPVHISSGDSFLMMIDWGHYVEIKLHGIDAPDENHAYFKDSQQKLADFINGKKLTVDVKSNVDGSIIGVVIAEDRGNANLYMLREGMAQVKDECASSFKSAEKSAKDSQKGIWQRY